METPIDFHKHFSWLRKVNLGSSSINASYQERLLRLEGDKESLVLQVSVLTDQVEAQGEKIRDLESSLEEHHKKLVSTEEMLQQELLSRTSLEGEKRGLMEEVSQLKLQMAGAEETLPAALPPSRPETPDGKQNKAEDLVQEVRELRTKVDELEEEKSNYERKLCVTKAAIGELQELLSYKDSEIHSLQGRLTAREGAVGSGGKDQEFQKLKRGMESLLASNDEKDRHIEELTAMLGQYRKGREVAALPQACSEEDLSSSHRPRALTHKAHSEILRSEFYSQGFSPLLTSSASCQRELDFSSGMQSGFETFKVTISDASYLNGSWSQNQALSTSLEELQSATSKRNRHMDAGKYRTLPGKMSKAASRRTEHLNGEPERERERSPSPPAKSHQDYSLSRPESLMEEASFSDQSPLSSGGNSGQQSPVSPENRKSHKGIRKIWGKIRRSQSGSPVQLDEGDLGEFRRGGYRATAGPRLARPGNTRFQDPKTPFHKWTGEQLCDWLEELGLGQYGALSRKWLQSGQTLVLATPQELEKEMGLKNALHRKKLQLAVKMRCSRQGEKSGELDHVWVTRWLDDIGLPQYKDQFHEGRVDGRMLQHLTVNDLLLLKVSSQLHHLSIKCAIHVLRANQFQPNCLKRRPSMETTPSEVVQWSNHRVMEWLRSVDLAEYAPNLRGSGVHGGLIILEPRFGADTLAMLLNIPPQKTLLRRHLSSNFSRLVGGQADREKREYLEAPGHAPLSTTAKIRPKKLVFSNLAHLRRRRPADSSDYICPLDASPPATLPRASPSSVASSVASAVSPPATNGTHVPSWAAPRGLSPIPDREPLGAQQVGPDDS